MDRTVITKRINRLAFDIEKLKSTLAAIENTDIAKYPENYNMLATRKTLKKHIGFLKLFRKNFPIYKKCPQTVINKGFKKI